MFFNLRASSPIWASELEPRENARTIVEAARGRGKELSFLSPTPHFRVSSRVPLARLLFTVSPKWKACWQATCSLQVKYNLGGEQTGHGNVCNYDVAVISHF